MITGAVAAAVRPVVAACVNAFRDSERITRTDFSTLTASAIQTQFGWTRTGAATMVDSGGAVVYGAHNLLLWSRDLRNTAEAGSTRPWVKGTGTGAITSVTVDGPLPGTFASRLTWSAETYAGRVISLSVVAGQQYTLIVYTRRVSGTWAQSRMDNGWTPVSWSNSPLGAWERRVITAVAPSTATVYPAVYANYDVTASTGEMDIAVAMVLGPDPGGLPVETTSSAIYLPRAQHYQTAGVPGLLLEGARTQVLQKTDDLTASPWSNSAVSCVLAASHRGRPTFVVTKTTTASSASLSQTNTLAAGVWYCRVYLWAGASSSTAQVSLFNVSDGFANTTVIKESGPGTVSGGTPPTITGLSQTEPTVLVLTKTNAASAGTIVLIYPGGSSSTTIGLDCRVQVDNIEAGSHASSYIPNSGTGTVLRAADSADIGPGPNFDAIFPPAVGGVRQGTLVIEWCEVGCRDGDIFALHSNGATTELISAYYTGGSVAVLCKAGNTNQLAATLSGSVVANGINRISIDYGAAGIRACLNGGTVSSNASATIPAPTHFRFIGSLASGTAGAISARVRTTYATQRASTAALQALSAL